MIFFKDLFRCMKYKLIIMVQSQHCQLWSGKDLTECNMEL
jgi:hypothetical protein